MHEQLSTSGLHSSSSFFVYNCCCYLNSLALANSLNPIEFLIPRYKPKLPKPARPTKSSRNYCKLTHFRFLFTLTLLLGLATSARASQNQNQHSRPAELQLGLKTGSCCHPEGGLRERKQVELDRRLLPSCHELASLWARLRFAYPSLAANLLASALQRPKSDSDNYPHHADVAEILLQAERAIGSSSSKTSGQKSAINGLLSDHSNTHLGKVFERLLASPSYARLLRQFHFRDPSRSQPRQQVPATGSSELDEGREIQRDEPEVTTSGQADGLEEVAWLQNDDQTETKPSPLNRMGVARSSLTGVPARGQHAPLPANQVAAGPNYPRKPPKHMNYGRVITHPSQASPGSSLSRQGETLERLHSMQRDLAQSDQLVQQQQQRQDKSKLESTRRQKQEASGNSRLVDSIVEKDQEQLLEPEVQLKREEEPDEASKRQNYGQPQQQQQQDFQEEAESPEQQLASSHHHSSHHLRLVWRPPASGADKTSQAASYPEGGWEGNGLAKPALGSNTDGGHGAAMQQPERTMNGPAQDESEDEQSLEVLRPLRMRLRLYGKHPDRAGSEPRMVSEPDEQARLNPALNGEHQLGGVIVEDEKLASRIQVDQSSLDEIRSRAATNWSPGGGSRTSDKRPVG